MSINEGERTTANATSGGVPTDSFGNRLMLARAHAGHLSIREAADLCGIGRGAWTNWEKGARPVDMLDISQVISEKLGVDRDWLLFGGVLSRPVRSGRRRGASLAYPDGRHAPRTPVSLITGHHRPVTPRMADHRLRRPERVN